MKKHTILLIISFFLAICAYSQIDYGTRLEFDQKDGYGSETIIEFGKEGFIISSRKIKSVNDETEWMYRKYSTEMTAVKTTRIQLNNKLRLDETYTSNERTHSMFKDRKGNFSIVTITASNMEVTKTDGILPKKTLISNMSVLGDYAVFTARGKKESFIFTVNWRTGKKKIIPITINNISSKKISLSSFQTLKEHGEILVYVKAYKDKKTFDTYIIQLNEKGEKESVYNLTKNVQENIIDISTSKIAENKYVFTGTYSTKFSSMSEGLFFCEAKSEKINFIKFYNFLELEEFLTYLPKKQQEKITKKKAKKKNKGKEFKINYRIAAHDLISVEDGYLFLGEAYYPTTRTESYTTTSTVNGVTTTTTQTRQVFDGYQYTHALLTKFDNTGNLIWDQIFEMWPSSKPFYEKRFISIAEQKKNSIDLVFANRSKINSKSFSFTGKVLQESESEEIKSSFKDDEVKSSFSNIEFWYDNYFIAFGNQTIKNKVETKGGKKKRRVYFINKIKF